ncbi:spermidine/putrescine ABC transporter substrate-binding protein [Pectinatus frisingensis]|uniref:polyamine ABC transporter substrate-binding protein n=1 Tax=Pectinatus frisingensis TaxID=865 RepID=UPI0018C5FF8D|nr:spermidine/putrescine ABC transporter substrate-binding protein [Pectinatus frisingensis]
MISWVKKLVTVGALACMLMTVAGCGGNSEQSAQKDDKGDKELNLFIWSEYIPDSVIKKFEDESGIKVNVSNYSTNEECLAKVESSAEGTYDIVVPDDFMIKIMKDKGLLQKFDKDKITNLKNIYPNYMSQYYDPDNEYSVPYLAGTVLIAVNTDKVKKNITSFNDLLDPEFKDSIVAVDEERIIIGYALKALGYSMNDTDEAHLAQAKAWLQKLMPNIKVFDSDSPKTEMISGETSIGLIYNAEAALAMKENPAIKIVYPKEGMQRFIDSFCITAGSKHKEAAEQFINFILRPEIAAEITQSYPYTSVNEAAKDLLSDEYKNNPASSIPPDVLNTQGEFMKDVGDATPKFDEIWSEVKK